MKHLIILFFPLLMCSTAYTQDKKLEVRPNSLSHPVPPSASFWKTIYYDANWQPVKKKQDAVYYRAPVIKNGDKYDVEFFRMDNSRVRTGSYIPQVVNYQLSIDEGVGIKDGEFIYYYDNGQKESEGNYIQDKKEGEWKFYKPDGSLHLTCIYKDGLIDKEIPAKK